ncbi:MAG TPA: hypothetical protein PLW78_07115 [bacterium]|jgi:hypothetical protein|nr:hypothetical protein [bacterium]HRQ70055.1 hypothetical protein [bacterium]
MRIVIFAYNYEPAAGVGVLRPAYWAKHMNEIDPEIICDVITAQENSTLPVLPGGGRVITVKNEGHFLNRFKLDAGAAWTKYLERFFYNTREKYDVAIFTGGPFVHFFFAEILKRKFNSKIIFDFRDPFANNPNHRLNVFKRYIKRAVERKMLKIPDVSITVNKVCRDLLEKDEFTRVEIIDNGYDETFLVNPKTLIEKEKHRIVYAGKFYKGASPENLFKVLKQRQESVEFDYMGPHSETVLLVNSRNFLISGTVTYMEAFQRIAEADTGIILTGGEPFESTTKVFDYIGLEKNILIITNGEPKAGILHEITKGYPNVFWARNSENDIRNVLEGVMYHIPKQYPEKEKFSRRAGLIKLVNIINRLFEEKK